jgi:fructosamine-3-kinase
MQQPALAQWLEQRLQRSLRRWQPIGGGCIHNAWQLELLDGSCLFAKTNRAELLPVLQAEADGLTALGTAAAAARDNVLQIPEPLACERVEDQAVLVMEWLELGRPQHGNSHQAWLDLGRGLAQLHRSSCDNADGRYGWQRDNFIGSSPQPNGWRRSWASFFCEQRLGAQLAMAEAKGHHLGEAIELLEAVPRWLAHHQPEPCLVHGDLWSGNAGLLSDGGCALFDPAVYRGDREVDLAMARLFGGFPVAFFEGYQQEWPLPAGHQQRLELYNLYHLLNHANLFGGGYWQQCAASIKAINRGIPCAGSEPW